jgi:4-diphosphocytidyl-2-C-methyl-D-erythritol kinase
LRVALPARAKLNLDLRVVGRRDDGFHEIRTHMQAVDLHDLLICAPAQQTTFTADGLPVPQGHDNLILKAHAAVEETAGRELPTRHHLHKRIPPGSGLGGASSDAATTLRALKQIHGLDLDLQPIAARLGGDVPFFLVGGSAVAEGGGERLTPTSFEPAWFAIAWPGIELSTAGVYRAWDEVKGEAPNELRRAAARVDQRVQDFAERLGHEWQMTGSGSAFFRRCAHPEEGRKAIASLDCWAVVTQTVGAWG